MPLKAVDYKAIKWYAETCHLKPQLSAMPIMWFKTANGKVVKKNLDAIKLEYNAWNEQDKKERARQSARKK